jgi:hypothetical protein
MPATSDSCAGHINHERWDPAAMSAGCFYPPSCVVRPECPVQQRRSASAFTRAARYTELTEKEPKVFAMKENPTMGRSELRADCTAQ